MSNTPEVGYCKGERCLRDGCLGIIWQKESDDGCSCPCGNPPCSYCTTPREYCSNCDWDAEDEQDLLYMEKIHEASVPKRIPLLEELLTKNYVDLNKDTIDFFLEKTLAGDYMLVGCYPQGTTAESLLRTIREFTGNTEGVFLQFNQGNFIYVTKLDLNNVL